MSKEYDVDKEIEEYPASDMFKAGLIYYISSRKIKIKDKKDFDKIMKEYSELKMGE